MTKYLISFPSGAMDFPDEDLQAASDASHAVVEEAKDAGVWVFGGGIDESVPPVLVDGDGTVTEARTRRRSSSKAATRYWSYPPASRHWNGLRRSRLPAGVRRRCVRSITIPPADGVRPPRQSHSASARSPSRPTIHRGKTRTAAMCTATGSLGAFNLFTSTAGGARSITRREPCSAPFARGRTRSAGCGFLRG